MKLSINALRFCFPYSYIKNQPHLSPLHTPTKSQKTNIALNCNVKIIAFLLISSALTKFLCPRAMMGSVSLGHFPPFFCTNKPFPPAPGFGIPYYIISMTSYQFHSSVNFRKKKGLFQFTYLWFHIFALVCFCSLFLPPYIGNVGGW